MLTWKARREEKGRLCMLNDWAGQTDGMDFRAFGGRDSISPNSLASNRSFLLGKFKRIRILAVHYTSLVHHWRQTTSHVNRCYVPASKVSSGPLSSDSHIRGFWGYIDSLRAVDGFEALVKPWRTSQTSRYRYGSYILTFWRDERCRTEGVLGPQATTITTLQVQLNQSRPVSGTQQGNGSDSCRAFHLMLYYETTMSYSSQKNGVLTSRPT